MVVVGAGSELSLGVSGIGIVCRGVSVYFVVVKFELEWLGRGYTGRGVGAGSSW